MENFKRARKNVIRDYVGLGFNPDKYVFQTLLTLAMSFMVAYSIATSVPAWYVLEEQTTNFSTCARADSYVATHVRKAWKGGVTTVYIKASLWYLNIYVDSPENNAHVFMPFVFAHREPVQQYIQDGLLVESILPKSLSTVLTFVFLVLGIICTCCASSRPSRLVYYGLSTIMIVASITCWVTVAVTASEQYLLSTAADLCVHRGIVKTSFLLQMVSGSAGILAFAFGCVLIHVAVLISEKARVERQNGEQDGCQTPITDKIQYMYEMKGSTYGAQEKNMQFAI
ncbi:uncharacterized protein LOC128219934 [Mya arenaria]|uniref:uncharacterized protein LOC128219934 n=1 Tax=Mya arenaria TaxID=6604 RepID=UPI0022E84300|nr:uncharacterized protein LOC128219934 [Mya arenaria]